MEPDHDRHDDHDPDPRPLRARLPRPPRQRADGRRHHAETDGLDIDSVGTGLIASARATLRRLRDVEPPAAAIDDEPADELAGRVTYWSHADDYEAFGADGRFLGRFDTNDEAEAAVRAASQLDDVESALNSAIRMQDATAARALRPAYLDAVAIADEKRRLAAVVANDQLAADGVSLRYHPRDVRTDPSVRATGGWFEVHREAGRTTAYGFQRLETLGTIRPDGDAFLAECGPGRPIARCIDLVTAALFITGGHA